MHYSIEKCNILNCEATHHKDFLCKKHYKMYVIDDRISKIMQRLYRINTNKKEAGDWLMQIINNVIHYTINISIYYVEHFPLETLFIYHFKNVDIGNNSYYSRVDFLKDFENDYNHRIGLLKTHLKTPDSKNKIIEFAAKPFDSRILVTYIILLLTFIFIFFSTKVLSDSFPAEGTFWKILVSCFLALPTLIFGKKFIESSKEIFTLVLENKLYKKVTDNKQFILSSESIFNRQSMYNDLKAGCVGYIFGFVLLFFFSLKDYTNNQTWAIVVVTYTLALVSICLFALLFSVIWVNYFLLPIIRRFHNAPLKFELYDLDKSARINHFKSLLRNLLIYDILIITTLFTILYFFPNTSSLFIALMMFFTGWNMTSLIFFTPKISLMLHHQFDLELQNEMNSLTKSKNSDRFPKYDFIKTLKLNLFINLKTVWNIAAALIPFIASFIIDQNDKEILKYCKTIATLIRNEL